MKRLLFGLILLLAVLGAGCGGDEPQEESPSPKDTEKAAEEEETGPKVSITGNEYSFQVPTTITGGFVNLEFKNEGRLVHSAEFIKVDPDTPQAQFVKDLKVASGEEGGPIASYLKPYIGGNTESVKAGATGTGRQSLPAGIYYLVCSLTDADSVEGEEEEGERPALPQHFEQGMISKVTVTGPATVALPRTDATVAAKEYTFDVSGIKVGKNEVLFRNDGPKEIHMAAVLEFGRGVTEEQATKALQAFASEGPPPAGTPEPEDAGFSGLFEVGGGSVFNLDAKRDRVYAFACFIQDRAGGPPHIAKGMSTVLKVS
jgi:hypothetical protein